MLVPEWPTHHTRKIPVPESCLVHGVVVPRRRWPGTPGPALRLVEQAWAHDRPREREREREREK
ncbi:hypothetical protein CMUS01_09458 [Colletotrichum musicola]|uniref:Uncharacterized protein n=1 Tax=Colletotrichum musicola TaxID=2175873 RepID=A0A8H6K7W2_9PEZI|nr:hypothetical protein CMUS01_09458 [Colletotrichum musicola]